MKGKVVFGGTMFTLTLMITQLIRESSQKYHIQHAKISLLFLE